MDRRLTEISSNLKHYGFVRTMEDVAQRLLNRVVFLKVLKCVKIDQANPEFMACDDTYRGLFLSEAALREFAAKHEYEITNEFLDGALAKQDRCYGFLNGSVLSSYGWYSNRPTETDFPGLSIQFDDQYVYMYKGFTHPQHRGKRLHAIGMTRALHEYLQQGGKGILSYVEWNNFASLKSCYRMGYKDFGKIYALRIFDRYFLYADKGCRQYGFRLSTTSEKDAPVNRASLIDEKYSQQL